jgi:hypothetical protein
MVAHTVVAVSAGIESASARLDWTLQARSLSHGRSPKDQDSQAEGTKKREWSFSSVSSVKRTGMDRHLTMRNRKVILFKTFPDRCLVLRQTMTLTQNGSRLTGLAVASRLKRAGIEEGREMKINSSVPAPSKKWFERGSALVATALLGLSILIYSIAIFASFGSSLSHAAPPIPGPTPIPVPGPCSPPPLPGETCP